MEIENDIKKDAEEIATMTETAAVGLAEGAGGAAESIAEVAKQDAENVGKEASQAAKSAVSKLLEWLEKEENVAVNFIEGVGSKLLKDAKDELKKL